MQRPCPALPTSPVLDPRLSRRTFSSECDLFDELLQLSNASAETNTSDVAEAHLHPRVSAVELWLSHSSLEVSALGVA